MPIPLEEIVEGIRSGCCVILLGPDVAKNKDGEWMQSGLLTHLREQLEIEEDVDSLIKCDAKTKSRAYTHLRKYYETNKEPGELHRQLALIPAHLIVSITPDLLMKSALYESGVSHQFKYYTMNQKQDDVEKPTVEKPLLYNLLGCIENQQSLVLTHDDLLSYLFSVLGAFAFPRELTKAVQESQYFLFLGFDFEKWYLQLLLKLFLSEDKLSIATGEGAEVGSPTKDTWPDTVRPTSFYSEKYGVEFVDTRIEGYVGAIYEECGRQGLLREKKAARERSIKDLVDARIREGDLEEALDTLYGFIDGSVDESSLGADKTELLNEVNSHIGVLARNEKNIRKGVIKKEDAEVERRRIVDAIQLIVSGVTAEGSPSASQASL